MIVALERCVFICVDLSFLATNLLKIPHGGWFPLVVSLFVFTLLSTWKRCRGLLQQSVKAAGVDLKSLVVRLAAEMPLRVPGTEVFLSDNPDTAPRSLVQNLAHNKVLHERLPTTTVIIVNQPYLHPDHGAQVTPLGENIYRVLIPYGYMEVPDIPRALYESRPGDQDLDPMEASFFLSRETIVTGPGPGMTMWRKHVFAWMANNAESASASFHLPANRVVELGTLVEI